MASMGQTFVQAKSTQLAELIKNSDEQYFPKVFKQLEFVFKNVSVKLKQFLLLI